MVTRWAIIRAGVVENIVLWDGKTPWSPPIDTTPYEIPATKPVDVGWRFNGEFTPADPKREQLQPATPRDDRASIEDLTAKLDALCVDAAALRAELAQLDASTPAEKARTT